MPRPEIAENRLLRGGFQNKRLRGSLFTAWFESEHVQEWSLGEPAKMKCVRAAEVIHH